MRCLRISHWLVVGLLLATLIYSTSGNVHSFIHSFIHSFVLIFFFFDLLHLVSILLMQERVVISVIPVSEVSSHFTPPFICFFFRSLQSVNLTFRRSEVS